MKLFEVLYTKCKICGRKIGKGGRDHRFGVCDKHVNESLLTESYTALILDQGSRHSLERIFPPKYPTWIGHHVTLDFGVPRDTPAPPLPQKVVVYAYVDDGQSIEALAVEVDGQRKRADGRLYHITWSLDLTKRKPKDSNILLQSEPLQPVPPVAIQVHPAVLD